MITVQPIPRTRPRFLVPGHARACNGKTELSIRRHDGVYRIARACQCRAVLELAPAVYPTFGEAEAAIKPLRQLWLRP